MEFVDMTYPLKIWIFSQTRKTDKTMPIQKYFENMKYVCVCIVKICAMDRSVVTSSYHTEKENWNEIIDWSWMYCRAIPNTVLVLFWSYYSVMYQKVARRIQNEL